VRVGQDGQPGGRQLADLQCGRAVEQGDALHQVGQRLGPQAPVGEAGQQLGGPFGRMGRTPAADVPHAREHRTGRDRAPDAVGDAELGLHDPVPDVVRQPRPDHIAAVQPVHGAVVPLDQRVGAVVVRQAGERHVHIPTMRSDRTGA
jgi:hypothetical protein